MLYRTREQYLLIHLSLNYVCTLFRTANLLSTSGDIKPGDRVMVILPAIPEYWLIQAACLRTGISKLKVEVT